MITVEVDVEEAEKLALASTQGRLLLALRNPLTDAKKPVLTKGANIRTLLSSYQPKRPARTGSRAGRQGPLRVEIIKGDVRKEVKF